MVRNRLHCVVMCGVA